MEILDLYNWDREKKGTAVRGEQFSHDLCRLTVHVCLFNSKGQMLIQQRSFKKKTWSGLWDLTLGGGAISGETSRQAVERELMEELGIPYDFSNTRPIITVAFKQGFDDYYLIEKDIDLKDIKISTEEVETVKWASREEILKMIEDKTFTCYVPTFVEALFDLLKANGVFIETDEAKFRKKQGK